MVPISIKTLKVKQQKFLIKKITIKLLEIVWTGVEESYYKQMCVFGKKITIIWEKIKFAEKHVNLCKNVRIRGENEYNLVKTAW